MIHAVCEAHDQSLGAAVVASAYCVRKGLIRKANLAAHVAQCQARAADSGRVHPLAAFVPESRVIDLYPALHDRTVLRWYRSVRAAVAAIVEEATDDLWPATASAAADGHSSCTVASSEVWVLKPSLANKGAEIHLAASLQDVLDAVTEWPDCAQWVLQRYVERPLTLGGGHKFHLRVYVLAVGALEVFVYRECLCLAAALPHRDPRASDAGMLAGQPLHTFITNTCVNASLASFDEAKLVRLLSELPEVVDIPASAPASTGPDSRRHAIARVYSGVRECIARLFASYRGDVGAFMPLPNAFELFGVDMLVQSDTLRPILLEVNAGPDLKQTGSRLRPLIAQMLDDMLAVSVDRLVDGPVPGLDRSPEASTASSSEWDDEAFALPDELRSDGLPFRLGDGRNGWDCVYSARWATGGGGGPSIHVSG